MRVLHILAQLRASGAEVMLQVAAPHWRRAGVDLHVLETSEEPGHFALQLEDAGYKVLRIPLNRHRDAVRQLTRLFREHHYDVVHIHPEGADLIPGLAARLAGVPAVRTVHHIFPYSGFLRWRKTIERFVNRRLGTHYLCNSLSGSANERQRLRNPHRLAFNWYDDDYFQPPTTQQRSDARLMLGLNDEFVFVSVGGCADYKNHDLILRSLVRVPGVRYLHVGPERDDTERRLADELGLMDRVTFMGVVPEVLSVLHAADGYLMPSTIEGFGVAAVEALGAGVPVILSDRPALCDLRGQVPGTWLPLDHLQWSRAMQALAERPEEERLVEGRKASRVVGNMFGSRAGAEAYLAAWRAALR